VINTDYKGDIFMRSTKTERTIRAAIGDPGFEYYVRKWKDGSIWVGAQYFASQKRTEILFEILKNLGYSPKMEGQIGTVGQYILKIESEQNGKNISNSGRNKDRHGRFTGQTVNNLESME
jgi:hypothetical protein